MDADVFFQASAIGVYGEQIGTKIVSLRVGRFSLVGHNWYLCAIFIRQSCGDGQSAVLHTHTHARTQCSVNKQRQYTHPHPHCPQRIMSYNRISKANCHAGWVSICHMKVHMYGY